MINRYKPSSKTLVAIGNKQQIFNALLSVFSQLEGTGSSMLVGGGGGFTAASTSRRLVRGVTVPSPSAAVHQGSHSHNAPL